MLGWTFSARTLDEVAALLRAMGRHRYVRESDHGIHWSVSEALSDRPPCDARRSSELAGEQVNASACVYVERICLAYPELARGAPRGVLPADFLVWSDGDYCYVDYVFRGVAKAARLVDPPVGIREFE